MNRSLIFVVIAAVCATASFSATFAQTSRPLTQKQALLRGVPLPPAARAEPMIGKLIVKLRNPTASERVQPLAAPRVQALSKAAGVALRSVRAMSGDASVVALPTAVSLSAAKAIAAQLAADPAVEYAVPNILLKKAAVPNETRFNDWQWNLFAPTATYMGAISGGGNKQATATGGANLPAAWDITTGAPWVTVAVIDSGIVNHNDLNGINGGAVYTPTGRLLAGYDFVSREVGADYSPPLPADFVANDGDGRDADPTDPGDWVTAAEKSQYPSGCSDDTPTEQTDSSWHGTHTAGVIAATANNGVGIAGIGWQVRMLPVRALGKCGGALSDVTDAIRWSAGLSVPNVPANPTPARVINLSLGGDGSCLAPLQEAVTAAIGAGSVVIAATGNGGLLMIGQPANCAGAIAVTAHTINGENADYADVGAGTTLSAPGGGSPFQLGAGGPTDDPSWHGFYVWSTVLFGQTGPTSAGSAPQNVGSAYSGFSGTSAATPHVAGVAALIKALLPNATPQQVRNLIVNNVRPHPTGSACAPGGMIAGQCGAGMLDAALALQAAAPLAVPVIMDSPVAATVQVGQTATFTVSSAGLAPFTYQWFRDGTAIAGATLPSYTTPVLAVTDSGASYTVTVTNSLAAASSSAAVVTVIPAPSGGTGTPGGSPAAPPTGGGGGGGSLPLASLWMLAFAAVIRIARRPQ